MKHMQLTEPFAEVNAGEVVGEAVGFIALTDAGAVVADVNADAPGILAAVLAKTLLKLLNKKWHRTIVGKK